MRRLSVVPVALLLMLILVLPASGSRKGIDYVYFTGTQCSPTVHFDARASDTSGRMRHLYAEVYPDGQSTLLDYGEAQGKGQLTVSFWSVPATAGETYVLEAQLYPVRKGEIIWDKGITETVSYVVCGA
jgi:hypothetical protein